VQTVAR